jgi:hypothetical protein
VAVTIRMMKIASNMGEMMYKRRMRSDSLNGHWAGVYHKKNLPPKGRI